MAPYEGERPPPAIRGDEVAVDEPSDRHDDREAGTEPEIAEMVVGLRHLIEAGGEHHDQRGRGKKLVDRELMAVYVRRWRTSSLIATGKVIDSAKVAPNSTTTAVMWRKSDIWKPVTANGNIAAHCNYPRYLRP